MDTSQAFAEFSQRLHAEGARAALAYLVGLTDYRFIGIFRFQDGHAAAAIHYDKQNPDERMLSEVPESATYCCFVRDTRGVFVTADALSDTRLVGHAAREQVLAYCGVPLLTPDGDILGTLCHYDVVARDPGRLDLALLVQVASALVYGAHVPAYPYPRGT